MRNNQTSQNTENERLELINQIYDPYSHIFIKTALQNKGGKVLDIACTLGKMSCWFARQTSIESVLGIDVIHESIEKAQSLSKTLHLNNAIFKVHSVYDLDLLEDTFDIIYLRFVLIHLTNPIAALRAVYNKLNPGGMMICETSIHNHCFSDPSTSSYDQFIKYLSILFTSQGKEPNIGNHIFSMCRSLQFSIQNMNYVQPLLKTAAEKKLMYLSFLRAKESFEQEKIVTSKELDDLERQMTKDYQNSDSVWAAPAFCQVMATK